MVLLVIIVYAFSMAFRQLSHGTGSGKEYFQSVPHGMKTLLIKAAMPDASRLIDHLASDNAFAAVLAVVYFFIASLTLLNMLIGVLCEVINVVSSVERESMRVAFVKSAVVNAFKETGIHLHDT